MITNSAEIRTVTQPGRNPPSTPASRFALLRPLEKRAGKPGWALGLFIVLLLTTASMTGSTVLGTWTPIFKGIDQIVGTNTPGAGAMRDLQVMSAVRIDLTDPDIRLLATPPYPDFVADYHETAALTVSNFVTAYGLQVAINANNFHLPGTQQSPGYKLAAGSPLNVSGLFISRGQVVSEQESAADSAALLFATNNQPTVGASAITM